MQQAHAQRLALLLLLGLASIGPAFGQETAHGNGALEVFDAAGMANSPGWVKGWIGFMMITFVIGLGFATKRVQARWVMGFIVGGFIALGILTSGFGLPQISGFIALIHLIFWTPALIILLKNRTFLKESSLFAKWTGLVTFVICFSFIFDVRDAAIYVDHIAGLGLLG